MTSKRVVISAVLFALVWVTQAAAHAATRVVLLSEHGTADAPRNVEPWAATRAQLGEIDVETAFVPASSAALAGRVQQARDIGASSVTLAVVWLERGTTSVTVFFYTPRGPHLYSRRLDAVGAPAAVEEEIAVVLRSAVSALLEGVEIGMGEVALPAAPVRRATPAAGPSRPPRHAPRRPGFVRLGLSYVGELYAVDADWQHGAALSLSVEPNGTHWFAGIGYTYLPPLTIDAQGVETRIRRHPAEVFGGFELELEPLWFIAEGSVIGDAVDRSTPRASEALEPNADSRRWLWALSTRLGGALGLTERGRVFFTVGAEFLLNRFDHVVVSEDGSRETVASPMSARPRVELGLQIALF